MKLVIQRVLSASVEVEGSVVGKIGKGLLVFVGVSKDDTEAEVEKYLRKMIRLRIFADQEGRTNLSLQDVGGELLLVSQFTLLANCRKGNRPSFVDAGDPQKAEQLYEYMIAKAREEVAVVQKGIFGADMKVCLENNGPFTIVLEDL